MRLSELPILAASLLLPSLGTAVSIDCSNVRVKGTRFNFAKLGGPHSTSDIEPLPPSIHNTTWTVDLCGPLKKDKNIEAKYQCPGGTYGMTPTSLPSSGL
jgi:autophagy-related protein 27